MNFELNNHYFNKNPIFKKLSKSIVLKLFDSFSLFLVFLIISRYLGPTNLGKFIYLLSFVLIIEPFGRLGMRQILIAYLSKDIKNDSIVSTCLIIELSSYIFFLIISLPLVINFIGMEDILIYLLLSFAFVVRVGENLLNIFYVYKNPVLIGKIQISSNIIFIFLTFLFYYLRLDLIHLSIIYLVNYLIKDILIIFFLKNKKLLFLIKSIDKRKFKKFIEQGSLISLSAFLSIILFKIDIIFINNLLGDYFVGIYSPPSRLVINIAIFIEIIALNLIPYLPKTKPKNFDINLYRLYKYIWLFSFFASIIFIILGPIFISVFFGNSFLLSQKLVPFFGISLFFNGIAIADNAYLNFYNLRSIILIKSFVAFIINIILNSLLIPAIGIKGAAIALVFASAFNGFGGLFINKKNFRHYKSFFFPKQS